VSSSLTRMPASVGTAGSVSRSSRDLALRDLALGRILTVLRRGSWLAVLTSVVFGVLSMIAVGSAGAVPKPLPKFWSPARCEHVMGERPITPPAQVVCLGSGGPANCRWTSGHRARVYSQFTVFALYGIAIRSFTLLTRPRPGFVAVPHDWGGAYAGWPPDFYRSKIVLRGPPFPARFRADVAAKAASLRRHDTAVCTG